MRVHFICRGNAFRSIISEAYLKSRRIPGVDVFSSGTVAAKYKTYNQKLNQAVMNLLEGHKLIDYAKIDFGEQLTQAKINQADINICMNSIVFDEAIRSCSLPDDVIVWDISDFYAVQNHHRTAHEINEFCEITFARITTAVDELIDTQLLYKD